MNEQLPIEDYKIRVRHYRFYGNEKLIVANEQKILRKSKIKRLKIQLTIFIDNLFLIKLFSLFLFRIASIDKAKIMESIVTRTIRYNQHRFLLFFHFTA